MRIMITGCAGFIGSHACDTFLENKYFVLGLDKLTYASSMKNLRKSKKSENFIFVKGDIKDTSLVKELCAKYKIECIINFAAETHVDNSIASNNIFIESNISGIVSLLEVCKELNIKIMHISTDEVYGPAKANIEFSEYSNLKPKNPYSASKAAAEHFVDSYSNTFGIEYLIVRPSNNFGPRQHKEKFIPTIITKLLNKEKIPVYGDGNQSREWTYVKDTAKSIEFILKNSSKNQIYNITSKIEFKNIQTIKNILYEMGISFKEDLIKNTSDRLGHDTRYCISNQKLNHLGWHKYSDYKICLKETVDFYRKN